eukprot:6185920-Pleurochrysis_carterae.AAC.1
MTTKRLHVQMPAESHKKVRAHAFPLNPCAACTRVAACAHTTQYTTTSTRVEKQASKRKPHARQRSYKQAERAMASGTH